MTLTELLKQETNEKHIAIGKSPAFSKLLSPSLTKETYVQIITGWYDFMKNLETNYSQFSQLFRVIPDLQERLKTKMLEKDLLESDMKLSDAINTNITIPTCKTIHELIGILYVVEGSSLGAQFITKQLTSNINLTNLSFHFYNGYRNETITKWESFKKWVNIYGENYPESHPEIIEAANTCFFCLMNSINSYTKQ
jgi:heme oxygenase